METKTKTRGVGQIIAEQGNLISKCASLLGFPTIRLLDVSMIREFEGKEVFLFNPVVGRNGKLARAIVTNQEFDGGILLNLTRTKHRFILVNNAMLSNGWACLIHTSQVGK